MPVEISYLPSKLSEQPAKIKYTGVFRMGTKIELQPPKKPPPAGIPGFIASQNNLSRGLVNPGLPIRTGHISLRFRGWHIAHNFGAFPYLSRSNCYFCLLEQNQAQSSSLNQNRRSCPSAFLRPLGESKTFFHAYSCSSEKKSDCRETNRARPTY